jgi:tetratricopeptide (TPR) repeat protein
VDNARSRELFNQAIKIDNEYGAAWTWLAWTHFIDVRQAFTKTPKKSVKLAIQTAKKASTIDNNQAMLHSLWASLYLIQRQHEKAITSGEKSIELAPSYALNYALLAQTMYFSGRFDEAITLAKQSIRLSPHPPAFFLAFLGMSYRGAGRYQDALPLFKKLLLRAQKGEYSLMLAHVLVSSAYAGMGEYEKARDHWGKAEKENPKISLEWFRKVSFFKNPENLENVLRPLKAAGIK